MDFQLEIFKDTRTRGSSKVLLTKDGRLYFSRAAMEEYNLKNDVFVIIATNKSDINDKNIYLIKCNKGDDYSRKISKVGYLDSKKFFRNMKLNTEEHPYFYSIKLDTYNGKDIIQLTFEGESDRRKKNELNNE